MTSMVSFSLRTKVCALSVLFHLSSIYVASGASCGCSSLVIPVHVDALVPMDPTDFFGGLKSNESSLRRLDDTYNIFGVFCQPETVPAKNADVIQLLVHGFTYNSEYWSPPVEEFRNYSYAEFACNRGLSTLAIDGLGVGLSSRPENASDVQYASSAAAVSQLARHLRTTSIMAGVKPFKKIIGVGHSAGSILFTFGGIAEGAESPFDGLILTGLLIIDPATFPPVSALTSARDDTPLRWGALDPSYLTGSGRSFFYPPDPTSFSPRMVIFDDFTKDVGSLSTFVQVGVTSLTSHYTGPVAKVVGSEDQVFCAGTGRCGDIAALTAKERLLWPEARSFEVVVAQGSGHVMNLDFFADGPFNTIVNFVNQFASLS
ncbi:Alpha/beta hydrolase family-domain-containing protein [Mycena capillaripes]|nr:Alpha/beta hydrolase family-domain-containing protein [Mycena capillaripes]